MILQRDPRMREEIKKNGCYLMSCSISPTSWPTCRCRRNSSQETCSTCSSPTAG
jgi:hypothetical protein